MLCCLNGWCTRIDMITSLHRQGTMRHFVRFRQTSMQCMQEIHLYQSFPGNNNQEPSNSLLLFRRLDGCRISEISPERER